MYQMRSFSEVIAEVENINWFLLLLAVIAAAILLCNLCAGKELLECYFGCGQAQNEAEETAPPDQHNPEYGAREGPHTWETSGSNQSPININTRCVEQYCIDEPLIWTGYNELPAGIQLENTGHTLLLRAAFKNRIPFIAGADLVDSYSFFEIRFRWSWHSSLGSEHTLDNKHYPLELQCIHKSKKANTQSTSSQDLLIISYMYSVSKENPFLDVLIQYLVAVQQAGQSIEVPPFPLNYLMPAFYTDFYSYHGSLTEPPCHPGAEWLINPQPLAISARQLHEFHKLRSHNGARIGRNARPVQELGDRIVYLNCFSS